MTRAQIAYGHARIRARKSRLVPPDILVALVGAESPALTIPGWLDLDRDGDAAAAVALAYARLVDDYALALRTYPTARPLLEALLGRHEIENVKLAWRAAAQALSADRWTAFWRPLGRLATVTRDACATGSLWQLVASLARTPYAGIAAAAMAAHASDLASAELAFDRWGSQRIVEAADRLPRRERLARALALGVVRERDVALLERALGAHGLSEDLAIRATTLLAAEWGSTAARRLPECAVAVRRALVATCARAFRDDVFGCGPPVAQVLLRERESRALISIAELRAREATAADARRALGVDGGG